MLQATSICKTRQRNDNRAGEQNGIIPGHVATGRAAPLHGSPPNENTARQVNRRVVHASCFYSPELESHVDVQVLLGNL